MKYLLSVFLGAASYGILSTIVVYAYGQGYELGEVVGSQLLMGFILACGLALFTKWRERLQCKGRNVTEKKTLVSRLTWKQRLLLMAAGMPTAVTGLLYYQSLKHIPASLAIILLFQFTWISIVAQAVRQRRRPSRPMMLGLGVLLIGLLLGLFGAFIPPVLFAVGVPRIGEGMAGILGASELPVAVMMSAFVLNEYVSVLQWTGVATVLIGIALPELLKWKRGKGSKQAYHIA
ncbi:EamA family transporter [Paenibacillus sp. MCAF20]